MFHLTFACLVMECLAEVSHVMTHHLGCLSRTPQVTNSAIMRKWKWLFLSGCACKSFDLYHNRILSVPAKMHRTRQCAWGIMLKYNYALFK